MQCNCIEETTKRMTERMTSQLGATAKAECKGTSLIVTDEMGLEVAFVIPFQITADKPGYRKGKVMNMVGNFCPICGKSAKKPKDEATADQPAP